MLFPPQDEDRYSRRGAPQALRDAVDALCADTGHTADEMEQRPLNEIVRLAQDHYGAELPFFWRNWLDWQQDDGPQPMGEL